MFRTILATIVLLAVACGCASGPEPITAIPTAEIEASCDAGEGRACAEKAWRIFIGRDVEYNVERARKIAGRYCDRGVPRACMVVGYLYFNGLGVRTDFRQAFELFDQGCAAGEQDACAAAALRYSVPSNADHDPERTRQLQVDACKKGSGFGCYYVADAVYRDDDVLWTSEPERVKTVLEYSHRGCELADSDACELMGDALVRVNGSWTEKSLRAFERACKFGTSPQCERYYSVLVAHGDPDEVGTKLDAACRAGDGMACSKAGEHLIWSAHDVDPERVHAYFSRACELNDPEGCSYESNTVAIGYGVSSDLEAGVKMMRRCCNEYEDGIACDDIDNYETNGLKFSWATDAGGDDRTLLELNVSPTSRLIELNARLKPAADAPAWLPERVSIWTLVLPLSPATGEPRGTFSSTFVALEATPDSSVATGMKNGFLKSQDEDGQHFRLTADGPQIAARGMAPFSVLLIPELPSREMGVGGKWRLSTVRQVEGEPILQQRNFEITALEDNGVWYHSDPSVILPSIAGQDVEVSFWREGFVNLESPFDSFGKAHFSAPDWGELDIELEPHPISSDLVLQLCEKTRDGCVRLLNQLARHLPADELDALMAGLCPSQACLLEVKALRDVDPSGTRAMAVAQKLCDQDPDSCLVVELLPWIAGPVQSRFRALTTTVADCLTRDDSRACFSLWQGTNLLLDDDPLARNRLMALSARHHCLVLDEVSACSPGASLFNDPGLGVYDPDIASEMLHKACELGDQDACDELSSQ